MTENNIATVVDEPSTPPAQNTDQATAAGTPPAAPSSALPLGIALLALILGIGVAIVAYFTWHEVQRLGQDQASVETVVGNRIQPLRTSLDGVKQTLSDARQSIDKRTTGLRDTLEARLGKLEKDQQSQTNRLGVLAAMMGRSERGWTLAEVEYLLRIANQRLQLQRDVKTAEQALRAADGRLQNLADPHYLSVRKQITHDLEALAVVPAVDTDGLSVTLTTALAGIDELPVAGTHYQPPKAVENPRVKPDTTAHTLKEFGQLVWASLSDLFRLREHDQPVRPMLPPEREYFLRENLRLQLAAARLALLRNDSVQYRSALQTAKRWLLAYFDPKSSAVQQLGKQLKALATVNIAPVLPDISASLHLLRQQIRLSEQPAVLPVVPEKLSAERRPDVAATEAKKTTGETP